MIIFTFPIFLPLILLPYYVIDTSRKIVNSDAYKYIFCPSLIATKMNVLVQQFKILIGRHILISKECLMITDRLLRDYIWHNYL